MNRTVSHDSLDIKSKEGSITKSDEATPKLSAKSLTTETNGSSRRSLSQGSVSYERLRSLKIMVDRAIKEHRVFSVAGPFPTIRQALKQRGWLEKMGSSAPSGGRRKRGQNKQGEEGEENPDPMMVARLLRNCAPDLLWALRSDTVDWRGLARWQLVNRFPKALFTTKIGLSGALQHMQWFTEEGVSETLFPRCYCVNQPDEMVGFVSDFRLTACYSLLRNVINTAEPLEPLTLSIEQQQKQVQQQMQLQLQSMQQPSQNLAEDTQENKNDEEKKEKQATQLQQQKIIPPAPPKIFIPTKAVIFALTRAQEHVRHLRHDDVDDCQIPAPQAPAPGPCGEGRVWDCEWDQFLTFYYQCVHDGAEITWESPQQREELTRRADEAVREYIQLRPFSGHDGTLNLWIVKPGARSCGRGIQVMNRLENILARTQPGMGKESRFVVQKYIERPLLIYNTKFDIRQWFLITSAQPLTIWMYRESYLRFCSQIFDMKNLHESVHLSNNAVQCRYQNCRRDPALPDENMWDCYTFQTYLRSIGRADAWDEVIYPGMRAGIIGAMLASQDWLDSQRNCFELYGADFLLSEGDLRPWLLEVNCSPCMAPSTSVTARMCAQCLEDVLRVVVDRRDDREASTGMFELVYRQHSPPAPPYQGVALGVKGRRLTAAKPRRRKHKRGPRPPRAEGVNGGSSSCSSSCSSCSSQEEEDESRLNLTGQHRVSMVSPLKVVKAEMNIPVKHKRNVASMANPIIGFPPSATAPALSATELRVRLERLLADSAREKMHLVTSSGPPSRIRSALTIPTTPPVKIVSPTKGRKGRKSTSTGKFKGKISGKNIVAVERDIDVSRYLKEIKTGRQSKLDKKNKDGNNNSSKKISKKLKDLTNEAKKCENEDETNNENNEENDIELKANNINNNCDDKNEIKLESDLLLQADNLRSTKVIISTDTTDVFEDEDEGFKDPGRSLALVKEWRRRLEATRASCEQMLAQLKAFRDPIKPQQAIVPQYPVTKSIENCNSSVMNVPLGRKIRKMSSKDHKLVAPVVSPA